MKNDAPPAVKDPKAFSKFVKRKMGGPIFGGKPGEQKPIPGDDAAGDGDGHDNPKDFVMGLIKWAHKDSSPGAEQNLVKQISDEMPKLKNVEQLVAWAKGQEAQEPAADDKGEPKGEE
jgi:hypothetical protein